MRTVLVLTACLFATPALAQDHDHGGHEQQPAEHGDHQQHDQHRQHGRHQHHGGHQAPDEHAGHDAQRHGAMTGALGPYAMSREASGTSWQPEAARHGGLHSEAGEWTFMSHIMLNGIYSSQAGPRGDDKAFFAGMLMAGARRDFDYGGMLNLRAMLSPDPLMGKNGYPLLLAAGETADGAELLVDRQHPHDLFMELSASYAHPLSGNSSVYVYAGLPGEPAFGPPAFMHRPAAMDSPEAPITHHWLDSTHITFGVLTLGYVNGDWKFEASRFRGREPDEERYDIETGALDSTAFRVTWNPAPNWSLQTSWADVTSPEQLEPDENEQRWSASALYSSGPFSATFAFARKSPEHGEDKDAWLLEAAYAPDEAWTLLARAEHIETDELGAVHHGPIEPVARVSLGAIHDWQIADQTKLGIGLIYQRHFVSDALSPLYDGDQDGVMAFVRLRVD